LKVSINPTGGSSTGRFGTSPTTNDGFEYGSDAESAIDQNNVRFFFYDDNGIFVTEANVWEGNEKEGTTTNVEKTTDSILVLSGLTSKTFPSQLVTVLNAPTSWAAPRTLTGLLEETNGYVRSTDNTDGNFIMTTSSYDHVGTTENSYVTHLTEDNFQKTVDLAKADANVVKVYVERLAVRVDLKFGEELKTKTEGSDTLYELGKYTIAGQTSFKDVYVKFLGWGLNGQTTKSYYMKHLDNSWSDTNLGFTWNDPTNFRSYWAQSVNYGSGNYPRSYTARKESATPYTLKYLTPLEMYKNNKHLDKPLYCSENTNPANMVNTNFPNAVTSVMLLAQLVDNQGKSLGNIIRYNGMLFEEERYIEYVLTSMKKDAATADAFKYMTADSLRIVKSSSLNGRVVVQLTKDARIAYAEKAANMNQSLASFNKGKPANRYKNGLMYYCVPIEHLNDPAALSSDTKTYAEGMYGVVRNHIYRVTITELTHLGYGIDDPGNPGDENIDQLDPNPGDDDPDKGEDYPDEDPDNPGDPDNPDGGEPIVPNPEDMTQYYVGARINILSWRVVTQNAKL
jgi:hypothetical protein